MFRLVRLPNGVFQTGSLSHGRRSLVTQQLQYADYGDPTKVLELKDVELSDKLKPEQVLVKWLAAPINPADINQIQGVYPVKPPRPAVGGNEGFGRIEAIGDAVKGLAKGDHVVPSQAGKGCWRRHGVHDARDLVKIDADLSVDAAATLLVNPPTAYRMLSDFVSLKPGDCVIQNGGNSAVGRAVIQIAKARGLVSINLVRERKEVEMEALKAELKALGADHVLTEQQLLKAVSGEFAGNSPKLALNCVGGRSALIVASSLADDGVMVTYGGMSTQPVQVPTGPLIFRRIRLCGFWMSHWYTLPENDAERQRMFSELSKMIREGKLKPPTIEHVPLADFKTAIASAVSSSNKKQLLIL